MVDIESFDTDVVKLSGDPKEDVKEAFGGFIPDVKYADKIEYKIYGCFGIRIETDHPEKDRVFWRGIKDGREAGIFGHPTKKEVSAEKIRSKWLKVLKAAKQKKQKEEKQKETLNIQRILKSNGYENFEHFILYIKNKVINGDERSLEKIRNNLDEILQSFRNEEKQEYLFEQNNDQS